MSFRPRRIIVLRHGETDHNARGVWQGQFDSELSDRGRSQAARVAVALADLAPDRVVASDLRRAAETGRAVAEACGIPISYDARLREIHVGDWQGRSGAEIREAYPEDMDSMLHDIHFRRGGSGESLTDVATRCREFATELVADLGDGQCVLLATHGVAGRAFAAELCGIPLDTAFLALGGLGNCHWTVLVEGRSGWRIDTWNAAVPDDDSME